MKKLIYILMAAVLISCGNIATAGISSDTSKGADGTKLTAQSILSGIGDAEYVQGELLVKFRPGVSKSSAIQVHRTMGASVINKFSSADIEYVKLPEDLSVRDAIQEYMSDPDVEYAEPNYIRHIASRNKVIPNDTYFKNQWGLRNRGKYAYGTGKADISATMAWTTSVGNHNVVVAVLDTGIDYTHPDLVGNIWTNSGETSCVDGIDNEGNGFIDDCIGWDFTTCAMFNANGTCAITKLRGNDPMDDDGHGTHVAGIIGAVGNNGNGVSGVMWTVQLMPVKVLNSYGQGQDSDIIAGIDYTVLMRQRGADIAVINASFGGGGFDQALSDAIQSANSAGILFVAAAGNGSDDGVGDNNDLSPFYPASYDIPNIISVAATDQDDRRVPFSNFGPNSVHVAAPGVYIWSTVPSWWSEYDGYGFLEAEEGTSMAAPHVSGLAGLLAGYYDGANNTLFTASQIKASILQYVDALPSLEGWIQTGGRINAYRSISSLLAPTKLKVRSAPVHAVKLKWQDNATGETGYSVERSTDGVTFTPIGVLPANSRFFTDTAITGGTTYIYRVRAFNGISDSFPSNAVSATPTGGR
jgi:subtilisin family serine protease